MNVLHLPINVFIFAICEFVVVVACESCILHKYSVVYL